MDLTATPILTGICIAAATVSTASAQVAFDRPVVYDTGGESTRKMVVADLNGDGHLDVAVACQTSHTLAVLLNNGDGTLGAATNYSVGSIEPRGVAVGDFNRDGHLDLATANSGANENLGDVSVLLNDGFGTFSVVATYGAGQRPRFIVACDLNADSYPDLAVTNHNSNDLSVLLNDATGNGTFKAGASAYPVGAGPRDVTAGDFDGDGNLDLAVANDGTGSEVSDISVLFNGGNGTFADAVAYAVGDGGSGSGPWSILAGDLDQDGDIDLAVAPHHNTINVWVLENNGAGIFGDAVGYISGGGPASSLALGDLDADTDLDVVVVHYNHTWSYLLNDGDATFGDAVNSDVPGSNPESVVLADLDEDSDLDLLVCVLSRSTVLVLINQSAQATLFAHLDIKPGACPNFFDLDDDDPLDSFDDDDDSLDDDDRLPVALMGAEDFDVTAVDTPSLLVSRADGEGGTAAPLATLLADTATPFSGEPCDCHKLEGDGITDLSMQFGIDEVALALRLNDLPVGFELELVVTGTLLDGTPFTAIDCIVIGEDDDDSDDDGDDDK